MIKTTSPLTKGEYVTHINGEICGYISTINLEKSTVSANYVMTIQQPITSYGTTANPPSTTKPPAKSGFLRHAHNAPTPNTSAATASSSTTPIAATSSPTNPLSKKIRTSQVILYLEVSNKRWPIKHSTSARSSETWEKILFNDIIKLQIIYTLKFESWNHIVQHGVILSFIRQDRIFYQRTVINVNPNNIPLSDV